MDLGTHDGVPITRTDFVPDGLRAGLIGLRLSSPTATTLDLDVDAHSELMKVYPWGETTPSQSTYNLADTGSVDGRSLVFREQGTPPVANAEAHDYAARGGLDLTPARTDLGPGHRGPQDPAVICPASGPDAPEQPDRCDDTEYGKGTGGALTYDVGVPAGGRRSGSRSPAPKRASPRPGAAQATALARPGRAAAREAVAKREALDAHTRVDLPGDRLLQRERRVEQAEPRRVRAGVARPAVRVTQRGQGVPGAGRARWRRRAGSAPAGPTTRGCSPPTVSTPPSRPSRPGSSQRSRTTCGAARRRARWPTAAAARSSTR